MRILQPNYEKSVEKGHLFKRVIVAGTIDWRGTLQVGVCVGVGVCVCVGGWGGGGGCVCVCVCVCDIHQFGRLILS